MPRTPAAKSASRAAPAAANTARPAKSVKAVTKPAKPVAPPATPTRPAAKTSVKSVVKSAAKALASSPARKPAAPRATAKPVVPIVERTPAREARPALVRDSFTMPEGEYAVLLEVKQACLRAGIDVKKSELLRIGVALLGQLDVATLQGVLAALPQLRTGRPPAQA
ncbi:hypothetical protein IFT68_01070 [Oxalobacteraceae sp. CFBP 13730]|nr:hypothetical protein [Oxalobacteraceae sp. CFBP 13730]